MWGLYLVLLLVIYAVVIIGLLFLIKSMWKRGLVLVVAVLIPNADDWYYRQQLTNYCENEAGIHVYEHASKAGGLLIDEQQGGDQFYIKLYPISFIETPGKFGGVNGFWRTDRTDNGITTPYKVSLSTALYQKIRIEKQRYPFTEIQEQIIERKNGNVLGEFKGLYYYGSWYPRYLIGEHGLVAGCGENKKVVSHQEWQQQDTKNYSINEVVKQIFSKE